MPMQYDHIFCWGNPRPRNSCEFGEGVEDPTVCRDVEDVRSAESEVDRGWGNVTVMEKMGQLLTRWKNGNVWIWILWVGEKCWGAFLSLWLMSEASWKVSFAVDTVNRKYVEHLVGKWIGRGATHLLYAKIQPNIREAFMPISDFIHKQLANVGFR